MKTYSCRFLQRAIFFAPDELRHCCLRYFHDGKMKGDVRIFPVNSDKDFSLKKVIAEKKNIIEKINCGEETDCLGCPLLTSQEWLGVEDEKIDLVSIENNTCCNMRCSYCSEIYYGGKIAGYNILNCLEEIINNDKVADDLQVSWGGGEPTIWKDFTKVVDFVNSRLKPKTQRFFSNAINYSEKIAALLHSNKASLTTSVDAGTAETFRMVRGVDAYTKVLRNLKKYYDTSPRNVVIKYIFTEENSSIEEIIEFATGIAKAGLSKANFLLSCSFKDEHLQIDQGSLIIYTHYLLTRQGANTCVFDEHVRPRICEIAKDIIEGETFDDCPQEISTVIEEIRQSQHQIPEIIVWGIGEYANYLLDKSITFRNSSVKFFVDSNPKKQGTVFRNSIVLSPEEVVNHQTPILIASSFWYHEILEQIIDYGIDRNRVFSDSLI